MADTAARPMIRHAKPAKAPCAHRTYRMTCEQYEALRVEARDRCQMCGTTGADTAHGFLVIDHDAAIGYWAVRGLLCSNCNTQLPYRPADHPGLREYLETPWYQRMLAALGIDSRLPSEPPAGAVVQGWRRRWVRTGDEWIAQDGYPGGRATWPQLYRRFGPHNCQVLSPRILEKS